MDYNYYLITSRFSTYIINEIKAYNNWRIKKNYILYYAKINRSETHRILNFHQNHKPSIYYMPLQVLIIKNILPVLFRLLRIRNRNLFQMQPFTHIQMQYPSMSPTHKPSDNLPILICPAIRK